MRSIAWVAVLGLSVLSQSAEAGRRHGSGGSEGSSGGSGGSSGGSIGGSGGSIGGSGGSIGGSGGSSGGFHGRLGRGRFGSSGGAYGSSGGSLGSSGGAYGSSGGVFGSSGGAFGSSGGAFGSSGGAVYGSGGSSGGAVIVKPVAEVSPDRAYLVLHVPTDATVYMLDQKMTMDGSVRNFVTPKLEKGKVYSVNVRVEWQREGQKFVARAQQKIRSGDKVEVEARLDSTGTSLVLAQKAGQTNVLELTADDAAPVASKTENPDVANNSR